MLPPKLGNWQEPVDTRNAIAIIFRSWHPITPYYPPRLGPSCPRCMLEYFQALGFVDGEPATDRDGGPESGVAAALAALTA